MVTKLVVKYSLFYQRLLLIAVFNENQLNFYRIVLPIS